MIASRLFSGGEAEAAALIEAYPFGLLVCGGAAGLVATPLPLLYRRDGEEAFLLGHFSRANPQVAVLERDPRALVVVQGPHGYISPSWMGDRTQAPTWNYVTAHFDVEVGFDHSIDAARHAVEELTAAMEEGRVRAWSTQELGERYERMARSVVAFRARIISVQAKFKLGQNERPDVLRDILEGLEQENPPLGALMRDANRARLA